MLKEQERERPCMAAIIVSAAAAVCLGAVVWATYAAFDQQGFDLQKAVWQPLLKALAHPAQAHAARAGTTMPLL
jgi:hypothetical protein